MCLNIFVMASRSRKRKARGLSPTVEDYLKEILLLEAGRGTRPAATGKIALALGVAPATVTSMLKALERGGLVRRRAYRGALLTPEGEKNALRIQRRHRVVELFLVKILGIPWSEVHDEAEALEHSVSDKVLERMDALLGRPTVDPHGDPIPDPRGKVAEASSVTLATVLPGEPYRVVRLLDQSRSFLEMAGRIGLRPGAEIEVRERDESSGILLIAIAARAPTAVGIGAAARIAVRAEGRRPAGRTPWLRPGGRSGSDRPRRRI
jgi:DtxR family transcriptional regulator, Mn-dependent transcriptional regulator